MKILSLLIIFKSEKWLLRPDPNIQKYGSKGIVSCLNLDLQRFSFGVYAIFSNRVFSLPLLESQRVHRSLNYFFISSSVLDFHICRDRQAQDFHLRWVTFSQPCPWQAVVGCLSFQTEMSIVLLAPCLLAGHPLVTPWKAECYLPHTRSALSISGT